jgi:acetyl esterase
MRFVLKGYELRDNALLRILRLPQKALLRLSGGATQIEGRTLDAQAQMMCFLAERFAPHVANMTPDEVRRQGYEDGPIVGGAPRPMRGLRDFDLGGGVSARWYLPYGATKRGPLLLYIHGGGFVGGGIVSHDRTVRVLADESKLAVLSIEYRLAPEHKFPAPVEDAIRAYQWARENADVLDCDPSRIIVGGDSAGGNLSAVLSRACRDLGLPPPMLQVLIYPATDFTRAMPSQKTFAKGFFLDARSIDYYLAHYGAPVTDERASPLLAKTFDHLPPAIVVTAGFDPLVDEGDAYAKKLKEAGNRVVHIRHDSLIHGFVNMMAAIDAARDAVVSLGREIRAQIG